MILKMWQENLIYNIKILFLEYDIIEILNFIILMCGLKNNLY